MTGPGALIRRGQEPGPGAAGGWHGKQQVRGGEMNSPRPENRLACQASLKIRWLRVMTHADNATENLRIPSNVSMKELINESSLRRSFLKGMISAAALSTIGIAGAEPAAKKKAAKKKKRPAKKKADLKKRPAKKTRPDTKKRPTKKKAAKKKRPARKKKAVKR